MPLNISHKQYILSSHKLDISDMNEYVIKDKYLYVDNMLNIGVYVTADGKTVFLLGNAFCMDKGGKKAEEDITSCNEEDICSATTYWTGRWVVITENRVITDATGLMGAFYGEKNGEWFISSSLALISRVMGVVIENRVKADGISWQILPYTGAKDVKKLLSTQIILFVDNNIKIVHNNWIKDYSNYTTSKKCEVTLNMLVNALENIHAYSQKKIMLALTGGKDSRVTFSALIKSRVPFQCYTAEHKNISSSDKIIPEKLAKCFGVKHTYIKAKKQNAERLNDYYLFCGGNSSGADALFYACGQFDDFDEDVIVIRSGIYESGQTYARSYTRSDIQGFAEGVLSYYSGDFKKSEKQKNALIEWLEITKENPIDYIDIRDRYYIEQRVGGWVAAIEQSLDVNKFTSIQIVNCAELLSVFLSCNEEERKALAIAYGVMECVDSKLLDFDINKRTFSDKLLRVKGIIRNPIRKLNNYLSKIRR